MSLLADLAAELHLSTDELRASLGGGDEALTPNNVIVGSDGSISYDFAGHIHAQGLDLDAGDDQTPPTERRIRWLRTSDGALVAQEYAYSDIGAGGDTSLSIRSERATAGTSVNAEIGAHGSVDDAAFFRASTKGAGATPEQSTLGGIITSLGPTIIRTFLDGNGASAFLGSGGVLAGALLNLNAYAARLAAFAVPAITVSTGNITGIARTGVGVFRLTHTAARAPWGYCLGVGTPQSSGAPVIMGFEPISNVNSDIYVYDAATRAPADGYRVMVVMIG